MIEVEETNGGLHIVDAQKTELSIGTDGWVNTDPIRDVGRDVETTIAGRTTELHFPEALVCVDSPGRRRLQTFSERGQPIRLLPGDHLVQVDASISVYVRFENSATLQRLGQSGDVILAFPRPTHVTVGFRSHARRPRHHLAIPPRSEGVAAALTHLSAALGTTSPDKSYPSLRSHPPLIRLADNLSIPHAIRDSVPETGIELTVPDDLRVLFVAAPLAYYAQASVSVEDSSEPRLTALETGFSYHFASLPEFQHEVASVLRRLFLLDCLVRNGGPYGAELAELPLLNEIHVDADDAYAAPPAERLAMYLEAPFEQIDARLPDWHLSTYVDPTEMYLPTLPHLLDRLSLIYLPEGAPPDRGELIERSLDDFYREGPAKRRSISVSDIELVAPRLYRGRVHGWLADGIPIDAFKAHPEAFGRRFDYLDRNEGPITITVVLNDDRMDDEQSAVEGIYRDRADELSIEVEIKRRLSCADLAAVFERSTDFVHYIGHCDEDGLRCRDGNISVGSMGEIRAQTFFLNACGSYFEGYELVKKGSIAGAVTLASVLDEPAALVGTAFARLLVHGFSIETALRISRRRTIMNKHYTVVGDGTHTISQGVDSVPSNTSVVPRGPNEFELTTEVFTIRDPGGFYTPYLEQCKEARLFGNEAKVVLSRQDLRNYLERAKTPIIYDGHYVWSEDLWAELVAPR